MIHNPIIFEGNEYKDILFLKTSIMKLSLWKRIRMVFSPEIVIESDVYCEDVCPRTKAVTKIISYSYFDLLKRWYRIKFVPQQGMEQIESTLNNSN